jgi:hypothetical protein
MTDEKNGADKAQTNPFGGFSIDFSGDAGAPTDSAAVSVPLSFGGATPTDDATEGRTE